MKKIPWWEPQIGKKEYNLIKKVLDSNYINEGEITAQFENKISKLLNVKYSIAVPNCTSAIYLSLKAHGVGAGDEVIVPDLTFIATANAVEMTGAKAVLVDIDKNNLSLDPEATKKAINKKTRAIIIVYVSGRAGNIKNILRISKKFNIPLIEDAAEAFMSKDSKKALGTFGDTGCFSLSPAKTITTGQGGLIVTNNKKTYLKLKLLKDHGRPIRGTGGNDIHHDLGFNFKFNDVLASIGIGQLDYLEKRIERMKKNYLVYKKLLSDNPNIRLYESSVGSGEVLQWIDAYAEERDGLIKFLELNNVGTRPFWHPIHTQKYYKNRGDNFPVSNKISYNSLWLPSSFNLTNKNIIKICSIINKFYKNAKK